ncbi:hypothetical protein [uncultured Algibacter sp.]|uniref:hypothetical protein n=1 Tax=uncultured Algibacter sp. TaxID=298659 RepID=UPI0026383A8A|nr:hypothetical protein [uncultured Algibacter sp.]
MKNSLLICLVLLMLSCSSDDNKPKDNTGLIGKWKLTEQYLDPGDGSGDFQYIDSDRVITFLSDGTVEINGQLCFMASEVGDLETGDFLLITDSDTQYDGEIIPNKCSSRSAKVYFDLPVSGNLILWYQCIEACAQKFKKI